MKALSSAYSKSKQFTEFLHHAISCHALGFTSRYFIIRQKMSKGLSLPGCVVDVTSRLLCFDSNFFILGRICITFGLVIGVCSVWPC